MKRFALVIAATVLLAGCVTAPKINWSERIGKYTFDQAVTDFGPPDKSAKLTDGTTVAEWLTRRSQTIVNPAPYVVQPGFYPGPIITPGYSTSYFPGQYLRLTFDANGKLTAEKQFSK
ncbi:MAG TPA: hypothetical protein VHG89_11855 [Verrucomicrobiae bacterium]|nr:hypothetical protein [Verrucomicrobiae bacterium]